jgi:membrane protein
MEASSPPPPLEPTRAHRIRDFLVRVVAKADEDRIFLLAGAITFNVLIAFIPLLLLAAGIAGFILSARVGDPAGLIVNLIVDAVPAVGGEIDLVVGVRRTVERLLEGRTGFSLVGAVIFVWLSTRLMGTLRAVLGDVFDVAIDRGIVEGKLVDALMVVVAGLLVTVNLGVTILLEAVRAYGVDLLGVQGWAAGASRAVLGQLLALGSVWMLFLLLYRWVPARRIPWRTVLVAATFTALMFEGMKLAFSWYVTSVADYGSTYGNLATVAILFVWIHYGSIVFILGGEVAQVYTMRRVWRMKTDTMWQGGATMVLALLLGGMFPAGAGAQDFGVNGHGGVLFQARTLEREIELPGPLLDHDAPYIVVHLAENRVFLVDGSRAIWSAPAGTGTGFRLAGAGQRWTFTTPQGLFRVLRKEKDPMWEAPDWYYVERGVAPPAQNSPARRMPGVMGTTAIYLGDGIAIHGTNSPQLLLDPDPERRRVSHGCIRLTNEAARELYHLVDVGTPVLIY